MIRGICNSVYNGWSHISNEVDESETVEAILEKYSELHRNLTGSTPMIFPYTPYTFKLILKATTFLTEFIPDPTEGWICGFERWPQLSNKVSVFSLPPKITLHIFGYLSSEDQLNVQKVCRLWNFYCSTLQNNIEVPLIQNEMNPMPMQEVIKHELRILGWNPEEIEYISTFNNGNYNQNHELNERIQNRISNHLFNTIDRIELRIGNIALKTINALFKIIYPLCIRQTIPSGDSMLARNISLLHKKTLCAYLEQLDHDEEEILNKEEWFDEQRFYRSVEKAVAAIIIVFPMTFVSLPLHLYTNMQDVIALDCLIFSGSLLLAHFIIFSNNALSKARKSGEERIKRLDKKVKVITEELKKKSSEDIVIQLNIAKRIFQDQYDYYNEAYNAASVYVRFITGLTRYGPSGPVLTISKTYETIERTGYRVVQTSNYSILRREHIYTRHLERYSYNELNPTGVEYHYDERGNEPFIFPISSTNKYITPKCKRKEALSIEQLTLENI